MIDIKQAAILTAILTIILGSAFIILDTEDTDGLTETQAIVQFDGGYNTCTNMPDTLRHTGYLGQSYTFTIPDTIPVNGTLTFIGWNTEKDGSGTEYLPGSTITVDYSVTVRLYACFETIEVVITGPSSIYVGGLESYTVQVFPTVIADRSVSISVISGNATLSSVTNTGFNLKAVSAGEIIVRATYTGNSGSGHIDFSITATDRFSGGGTTYIARLQFDPNGFDVLSSSMPSTMSASGTSASQQHIFTIPSGVVVRTDVSAADFLGWSVDPNGSDIILPGSTIKVYYGSTVTLHARFGEVDTVPDVIDVIISDYTQCRVGETLHIGITCTPSNAEDLTITVRVVSGGDTVDYSLIDAQNGACLNITGKKAGTFTFRAFSNSNPEAYDEAAIDILGDYVINGKMGDSIEHFWIFNAPIVSGYCPGIEFTDEGGDIYASGTYTESGKWVVKALNGSTVTFLIKNVSGIVEDNGDRGGDDGSPWDMGAVVTIVLVVIVLIFVTRRSS